jgi:hypothetical protein
LLQKSFDYFSEGRELIIAAERRHVYGYAIGSYDFRNKQNAEHFALSRRSEKAVQLL